MLGCFGFFPPENTFDTKYCRGQRKYAGIAAVVLSVPVGCLARCFPTVTNLGVDITLHTFLFSWIINSTLASSCCNLWHLIPFYVAKDN